LDLVVPVHNEARAIRSSIQTLLNRLPTLLPISWVITIIDNGSDDETLQIAEEICSNHPRLVRVISLSEKGRGRALRHAWAKSLSPIVAYTDIDLSTNIAHLWPLIEPIYNRKTDGSVGNRLMSGSQTTRRLKREILSRGYNAFVKILFPRFSITDAQCGFKAFSRHVTDYIMPDVVNNNWFFDTELLIRSELRGLTIHQIPVKWIEDLDSRVNLIPTIYENICGLVRLRLQTLVKTSGT